MKVLGLVGGTSWISTVDYYTKINQGVNKGLGDLNFSECFIYSFNFQKIVDRMVVDDWDGITLELISACKHLENSGAKGIILCANTLHHVADKVEKALQIPVINIATATAKAIHKKGLTKVGLLGTKFTMEYDFFKTKLSEFGIEAVIPSEPEDRQFVHDVIYEELSKGIFKSETKARYLSIIENLRLSGTQGIIAGCTEIPLLIQPSDIKIPFFDTTIIHCEAAIAFSLTK